MIFKKYIINLKNRNVKCRSNEVSTKVNIGKNCIIDRNVKISSGVTIGDNTYINYETIIDSNTLIGKFCSIGPQVYIAPGNHPMSYVTTHPIIYDEKWSKLFLHKPLISQKESEMTVIGNDVWIGARAIILSGVKVNNGAIVGAGAVVTKEVPAYAIVAGIPAKVIGFRFEEKNIEKLNNTNWWEWDVDKISKYYNKFLNVTELTGVDNEN